MWGEPHRLRELEYEGVLQALQDPTQRPEAVTDRGRSHVGRGLSQRPKRVRVEPDGCVVDTAAIFSL